MNVRELPQNSPAPSTEANAESLLTYRVELAGYCYRMLGSAFDAEDAVQETLERAWRSRDRYRGGSSVRSWLYRIATNICLDQLRGRKRRALPMDIAAPTNSDGVPGQALPEDAWVGPVPNAWVLPEATDPAELAVREETIRLAFVTALQHLSPRERSVLILRDVLAFRASEVADLLETTVPSVNGSLRRARATLATVQQSGDDHTDPGASTRTEQQERLLARYVEAFQSQDFDRLMTILHEEARLSMPPYALWIHSAAHIVDWLHRHAEACSDSRLVVLAVNGSPAYAHYRRNERGEQSAFAIQVLTLGGGRITAIENFLQPELFWRFGLPRTIQT